MSHEGKQKWMLICLVVTFLICCHVFPKVINILALDIRLQEIKWLWVESRNLLTEIDSWVMITCKKWIWKGRYFLDGMMILVTSKEFLVLRYCFGIFSRDLHESYKWFLIYWNKKIKNSCNLKEIIYSSKLTHAKFLMVD